MMLNRLITISIKLDEGEEVSYVAKVHGDYLQKAIKFLEAVVGMEDTGEPPAPITGTAPVTESPQLEWHEAEDPAQHPAFKSKWK